MATETQLDEIDRTIAEATATYLQAANSIAPVEECWRLDDELNVLRAKRVEIVARLVPTICKTKKESA